MVHFQGQEEEEKEEMDQVPSVESITEGISFTDAYLKTSPEVLSFSIPEAKPPSQFDFPRYQASRSTPITTQLPTIIEVIKKKEEERRRKKKKKKKEKKEKKKKEK